MEKLVSIVFAFHVLVLTLCPSAALLFVDESKKDINQPETESGAACPSETDVVVTKELKSEEAPNGASGGGVDEYSDVVEV